MSKELKSPEDISVEELTSAIQEHVRNGDIDEVGVNFFMLGAEASVQMALETINGLKKRTSATDASYNYIRKSVLDEVGLAIIEGATIALKELGKVISDALPPEPEFLEGADDETVRAILEAAEAGDEEKLIDLILKNSSNMEEPSA